jgi:FixJ family two-component response regulator
MRDGTVTVVVIDDDEAILRGVARMLDAEHFRVRTYQSARDFLDEPDLPNPDCILVDIRMPDLDGLELFRTMRAGGGEPPAVFMTGSGHVPTVVEAMREGALDLLAKPFTKEMLMTAIGRAVESSGHARDRRRSLADVWRLMQRLTPREAEVCALVACGLLNKRVAGIIGTTEKTVKVHRGRVTHKLGATSVAELVRLVDAVLAEADCTALHLDDGVFERPQAANIIIDVVMRQRAMTATSGLDPVDQWAMHSPR